MSNVLTTFALVKAFQGKKDVAKFSLVPVTKTEDQNGDGADVIEGLIATLIEKGIIPPPPEEVDETTLKLDELGGKVESVQEEIGNLSTQVGNGIAEVLAKIQ